MGFFKILKAGFVCSPTPQASIRSFKVSTMSVERYRESVRG